eukprot:tig00021438_g21448.t1
MDSSQVLAVAVALTACGAAAVVAAWQRHLAKSVIRDVEGKEMPGPKTVPLLGNLPEMVLGGGHVAQIAHAWREEYGPIVQCYFAGTPIVWIMDAKLAHRMLLLPDRIARPGSNCIPSPIVQFCSWGGRGLLGSNGPFHRAHRRTVVQAMNDRMFRKVFAATTERMARDVFPVFDRACEEGGWLDPRAPFTSLTGGVLMKAALWALIAPQTCFSVDVSASAVLPGGLTWERFAEDFAIYTKLYADYFRARDSRLRPEAPLGAFRRLEAAMESLQDKTGASMEDVRVDIHDLLLAGHDTTQTTLCFALAALARCPEVSALPSPPPPPFSRTNPLYLPPTPFPSPSPPILSAAYRLLA